jgi:protein-tyrosine phosphatase
MEVSLSPEILNQSEDEILTINSNGKYLLVELPFQEIPIFTENLLFQLQLKGLTPVIAHAERNQQIVENPMLISKFVDKGCLIQINAVSIAGPREDPIQQLCKKLLKQNLVHLIASDAHHPDERLTSLPKAIEAVERCVGPEKVRELFVENPRKVIDGKVISSG